MDPISIALGLAQFAPSIMRFFGAGEKPVAVAEKIVGIASGVTGTKTPEEALAAMRENAQLAAQFNLAVLAADSDLEKACLADRANARGRDTEIRKLTGGTNRRADLMVLLDVVGLVGCLAVLTLFQDEIPGEVVGILATIAGVFGACLRDAHQFEFGSSRGSKEKDDTIAGITRKSAQL